MKYIISGGGTGGHLYPGLEIAKDLNTSAEVIYIASKNGIDKSILESQSLNFPIQYWNLSGLKRSKTISSLIHNIIVIIKLAFLMLKSFYILKKEKPNAVIGVGGYVSFPIVYVASKLKIKTIIHEQNSYPGLTNRQLAKVVNKIAITYQANYDYFPSEKIHFTSNPRINAIRRMEKENNYSFKLNDDRINVLVLSGSLGSDLINNLIYQLAQSDPNKDYYLVTGKRNKGDNDLKDKLSNLFVYEYLDNIFNLMISVDLVISRGGATTIIELMEMKKLTIIIPSSNVVANHQVKNAQEYLELGCLKSISEDKLTIEYLNNKIDDIIEYQDYYYDNLNNLKKINSMAEIRKLL